MTGFGDAIAYLNDPLNWTRRSGILELLGEHLAISAVAVLAAFVLAFPVGVALGSAGRGSGARSASTAAGSTGSRRWSLTMSQDGSPPSPSPTPVEGSTAPRCF